MARLDELERKFEGNPRRYFAPLANEYRKAGDTRRAIELCRSQLPEVPGHISGHIVLGQALYDARDFAGSRSALETALSLDPENIVALRYLGDIARDTGDAAEAERWYTRTLAADPYNDAATAALESLRATTTPESAAQTSEVPTATPRAADTLAPGFEATSYSGEPEAAVSEGPDDVGERHEAEPPVEIADQSGEFAGDLEISTTAEFAIEPPVAAESSTADSSDARQFEALSAGVADEGELETAEGEGGDTAANAQPATAEPATTELHAAEMQPAELRTLERESAELESSELESSEVESSELESSELESSELESPQVDKGQLENAERQTVELSTLEVQTAAQKNVARAIAELQAAEAKIRELETGGVKTNELGSNELQANQLETSDLETEQTKTDLLKADQLETDQANVSEPGVGQRDTDQAERDQLPPAEAASHDDLEGVEPSLSEPRRTEAEVTEKAIDERVDVAAHAEGEESREDARQAEERVMETAAPFVTETMADLYMEQGYPHEALDLLLQLAEQRPNDESLQEKIERIEATILARRDAAIAAARAERGEAAEAAEAAAAAAAAEAAEAERATKAEDAAEGGKAEDAAEAEAAAEAAEAAALPDIESGELTDAEELAEQDAQTRAEEDDTPPAEQPADAPFDAAVAEIDSSAFMPADSARAPITVRDVFARMDRARPRPATSVTPKPLSRLRSDFAPMPEAPPEPAATAEDDPFAFPDAQPKPVAPSQPVSRTSGPQPTFNPSTAGLEDFDAWLRGLKGP